MNRPTGWTGITGLRRDVEGPLVGASIGHSLDHSMLSILERVTLLHHTRCLILFYEFDFACSLPADQSLKLLLSRWDKIVNYSGKKISWRRNMVAYCRKRSWCLEITNISTLLTGRWISRMGVLICHTITCPNQSCSRRIRHLQDEHLNWGAGNK